MTPGSGRCHHIARVSIFLAIMTLVVEMLGCDAGTIHTLTITSTEGGSVTVPGEGTFTYSSCPECCLLDLVAEPDEGYCFVEWTSDRNRPYDVFAATTPICVAYDTSITAWFGHECTPMVAVGGKHTVGLNDIGKVFAVGKSIEGSGSRF